MKALSFCIRYLGIPLIIVLTALPYYYFLHVNTDIELWGMALSELLAFVSGASVLAGSLVLCERLLPLEEFQESKHQQLTDVFYAISTGVLFAFVHPVISGLNTLGEEGGLLSGLPAWIQFIIGLALLDLVLYWWHRLLHESGNRFLWKIHEVHHAPDRFSFLAGGRAHLLDVLPVPIALAMMRFLLGLDTELIMWLLLCPMVTGAVHHTNVDFRLGIFNWIFPGPEMHRIHHDKDPAIALNYSTCFPIWDLVFGTTKPFRTAGETDYGLDYRNDERETYFEELYAPFVSEPDPRRQSQATVNISPGRGIDRDIGSEVEIEEEVETAFGESAESVAQFRT